MIGDFDKYMHMLFDEGEYVNFVTDRIRDLDTTSVWAPGKLWVTCNPFKPKTKRRSPVIDYLKTYRNFVIEFDKGSIEEQKSIVTNLNIPYATIVFSGNKSLHVVISLTEGVDLQQYRDLANRLKIAVPQCDGACLEPARLTRLPYNTRQPLVDLGDRVSLKTLNEWLNSKGATQYKIEKKRRVQTTQGQLFGASLTYKSLKFLSGQTPKEEAHDASRHTIKNLFEIGMDFEAIIDTLVECRQRALPDEPIYNSERAVRRLVTWVNNHWVDK